MGTLVIVKKDPMIDPSTTEPAMKDNRYIGDGYKSSYDKSSYN